MVEPDDIDIAPSEITITWDDGIVTRYPAGPLRGRCPCAECRAIRERGAAVTDQATAVGGHLVGGWGLSIDWSDGHHLGIYSWDLLRALAELADP